jgi:uncharacterized protein YkwD
LKGKPPPAPPRPEKPACPGEAAAASTLSVSEIERTVVCLINQERGRANRVSVRSDSALRRAARGHSDSMVARGYFAHVAPGGVTLTDRLRGTGYMRGAKDWAIGENLIWGTGSLSTPQSLVKGWMQSPPHKVNMLRREFREIGVGVVRGTPASAADNQGVTITTDYGFRQG